MSEPEAGAPDELFASFLLACDEALAAQIPLPTLDSAVPPELRQRLEQHVACLQLLYRCLPQRPAVAEETGAPVESAATPSSTADPASTPVGRFRIQRELGRGGFGIVFLADDPVLGRPVALKMPLPNVLIDPNWRERFLREGRAAAGLDHPNLVPVYEAGEAGLACYIASAYCPGPNLADWLAARRELLAPRLAAALVAELADAVEHAHSRGILHRDLKPSNILLASRPPEDVGPEEDELPFIPRITDFGLAKVLEGEGRRTSTGVIQGTPSYMSPEQAQGTPAAMTPATDVYALGVILYELLTGQIPFVDDNVLVTLEQVRSAEPEPPRRLRAAVERDLETICLTCLRKQPGQRYASARALAQDLRRFLRKERIEARPIGLLARVSSWCRRPERMRDAGLLTLLIGIISVLNMAVALLVIAGKVLAPALSSLLLRHVVITLVILSVPAFVIGPRMLARRLSALWLGTLLAPVYTVYMASLTGFTVLQLGEMNGQRDSLWLLALVTFAFCLHAVQFVATVIALFAYYTQAARVAASPLGHEQAAKP
jgi:hypothetical protein